MSGMGPLRILFSRLLDTLAPPTCSACDAACQAGQVFCHDCGRPSPDVPPAALLAGVPLCVVGPYRPPLSTAIVRFKYQGRPELSRALCRLLQPQLRLLELPADARFAPVPMPANRLAARGYNQAALLAQELARENRRACRVRLLRRSRQVTRQVGKSRTERVDNVQARLLTMADGYRSNAYADHDESPE